MDFSFQGGGEILRKKILSLALLGFLNFSVANAQVVTVTGVGLDKEAAVRDASRKAVEQVVGTFIDSKTLMSDLIIQFDEVYKKSQGFVKDIKVLSEGKLDDATYKVQARIDVDTEPNGKLINEITMIMQLNDPRIAVIVLENNEGQITHIESAESALNQKLLELGFSHVIDAKQVIKLQSPELLQNIFSGAENFSGNVDHATDFLVVGKISKDTRNISIPKYGESGMAETSLLNVKTNLKVDVLKYDTGEIVGTFTTSGIGIENNSSRASDNALDVIAKKSAEKLAESFKKFSAKTSQGLAFTISADDEIKLEQILNEIKSLGVVDNVQIREQKNTLAIISVESSQKPGAIVTMLKSQSKLGIFIEDMSNSACKLKIS